MARERRILLAIGAATFAALLAYHGWSQDPDVEKGTLQFKGLERTYVLHVPGTLDKTKPAPLIVCLHGGGGSADKMQGFTGFNKLSEQEGFIVVYPEAVEGHWNDGRGDKIMRSQREEIDDVGFISALIDEISKDRNVDAARVYATGASNGGIMSHRLGIELSKKFAAIAPVIGGIAEPLGEKFKPEKAVPVLILQGTEDPLVPYDGGAIRVLGGRERGRILSTDDAVKKWAEHNGCAKTETEELEDKDPKDGCKVKVTRRTEGRDGSEVVLYRIEGGGHTWPGGTQYMPERAIGRVCRDFDAAETIWTFFKKHRR